MSDKNVIRLRRARRSRLKLRELEAVRLCVYRSSQHMYAQVISADGSHVLPSESTLDANLRSGSTGNIEAARQVVLLVADGSNVLASASTLDANLRSGSTGNIEAAKQVGLLGAERAKAAGVTQVSFDRSGFKYHGRVKALADAAREGGLEF